MKKFWFDISNVPLQKDKRYKKLPLYLLSALVFSHVWGTTILCAQAQSIVKGPAQEMEIDADTAVAVSIPRSPLQDGVHLFGKAEEPGKFQTEYLIFKIKRNHVTGAFFMPSSSFDCFAGQLMGRELSLSVVESYEQQAYEHSVNLNQYHAIQQINNNDLRILDVCALPTGHTAQDP